MLDSTVVDVAEVSVSVNVDVVRLCVVDGVVDAAHVVVVVVVFVVDASGSWVVGNGCRGMDRLAGGVERRRQWGKYGLKSVLTRPRNDGEKTSGVGCTNRESTLRSRHADQRWRLGPLILSPDTREARRRSTKNEQIWRST